MHLLVGATFSHIFRLLIKVKTPPVCNFTNNGGPVSIVESAKHYLWRLLTAKRARSLLARTAHSCDLIFPVSLDEFSAEDLYAIRQKLFENASARPEVRIHAVTLLDETIVRRVHEVRAQSVRAQTAAHGR